MARAGLAVILFVGLLLATTAACAGTATPELSCPRMSPPPTLDGRVSDWPALPQVALASKEDWHPAAEAFAEYGGPDDLAAELWAAWDAEACYLAVQVRDNVLVRVRSIAEIDRGDSIVLSFVSADGKEVNEFVVAPLKSGYPVYRSKPPARAGEVRAITVGIGSSGEKGGVQRLVYEVAIPWSELAPLRGRAGERFALVVSVCDADEAGLKGCLERRLPVVLSESGIPVRPPEAPAGPPSLAPVFLAPEAARFDGECFVLRGHDVMLWGGQVDYAYLPPASWPVVISELKSAGMNLVGVAVPWSYHQPRPGPADLSTLDQFLSLCGREGLRVQLAIGPYLGEQCEAGGIPGWALALESPDSRWAATETWLGDLLPVVKAHQITAGGPVASVVVRPSFPQGSVTRLTSLLLKSGIQVPVLTANLPAARDNTKQSMANLLDTVSFYSPPSPDEILAALESLRKSENGPPVVASMVGEYGDDSAARGSADRVKLALAAGAKSVLIGDFAPGVPPWQQAASGTEAASGVIQASGASTAGAEELRLVGAFLRQFGPALARATEAVQAAQCDDQAVRLVSRVSDGAGFLFLMDGQEATAHHLRVAFTDPTTGEQMAIPEAGAITLPAGDAKALVMGVPVGRGVLRYCTSEVLGIGKVGERTVLLVYGDPDSPGEISLRWPGPPLVTGEVARQSWDPSGRILVLDYYHGHEDRCVLVDELEIVILPRDRAMHAALIGGPGGDAALSAGAHLAGAALWPDKVEAALDCPPGKVAVSALAPSKPSAVLVDGKPVDFTFTTPDRMVQFTVITDPFEQERRATSVWQQIGRAVAGGPPLLRSEFDRGWFMPEPIGEGGAWRPLGSMVRTQDGLAVPPGGFVKLKARFDPAGRGRMAVSAPGGPLMVFVNGQLIPELSGAPGKHQADIAAHLAGPDNELVIILEVPPRAKGRAGIAEKAAPLPEVQLLGPDSQAPVQGWQVCAGLGGEAKGWTQPGVDTSTWHFLRFGPWREQGGELAMVSGVGWYRVPFGLPDARQWQIPYQLTVSLTGSAALYLNGHPLGLCPGDGTYSISLPGAWLNHGDQENVLAVAVYGLADATGLRRVVVAADGDHIAKRRAVEIRF